MKAINHPFAIRLNKKWVFTCIYQDEFGFWETLGIAVLGRRILSLRINKRRFNDGWYLVPVKAMKNWIETLNRR